MKLAHSDLLTKLNLSVTVSIALSAIILFCANSAGQAESLPNRQRGYLEQFADVIAKVVQADDAMWQQLTTISKKLDRFYFARGHFPETDEEKELFRKVLLRYIDGNPYKPRHIDMTTSEQLPLDDAINLRFLIEPSITPHMVRTWATSPPQTWKADPGTVFLITNGTNYYCLLATSADCFPMRDLAHSSNRLRLLAHYCDATPRKQNSN